jgi:hypothetical protein
MLIDCLMYIVLFFVVTGAAFSFFYTCWDGSYALRKNGEDIANTLRAGEMWRADVRGATGEIRVENSAAEEVVRIPEKSGEVAYKLSGTELSRNMDGRTWRQLLPNVKASRMEPEKRQHVTAWRWEIELAAIPKKTPQLKPVFTFEAVPGNTTKL